MQMVAGLTVNHAVLQQKGTKSSNQFLSTLAAPGMSQYVTALKPCGLMLPHYHPRGNELYTVIYGVFRHPVTQITGRVSYQRCQHVPWYPRSPSLEMPTTAVSTNFDHAPFSCAAKSRPLACSHKVSSCIKIVVQLSTHQQHSLPSELPHHQPP